MLRHISLIDALGSVLISHPCSDRKLILSLKSPAKLHALIVVTLQQVRANITSDMHPVTSIVDYSFKRLFSSPIHILLVNPIRFQLSLLVCMLSNVCCL